jgi:hypothetical protein
LLYLLLIFPQFLPFIKTMRRHFQILTVESTYFPCQHATPCRRMVILQNKKPAKNNWVNGQMKCHLYSWPKSTKYFKEHAILHRSLRSQTSILFTGSMALTRSPMLHPAHPYN